MDSVIDLIIEDIVREFGEKVPVVRSEEFRKTFRERLESVGKDMVLGKETVGEVYEIHETMKRALKDVGVPDGMVETILEFAKPKLSEYFEAT